MKELISELRQDGLNDEEVVWYAVNMHGAVESEVREALNPGLDQAVEQGKASEEAVAEDTTPSEAVSTAAPKSSDGAWIAVNAIVLSAIVSSWTLMFSVRDLFAYSSREPVIQTLFWTSVGSLLLWSVLRQVSMALPGSRLACAVRPILFCLFAVGLESVFYFLMFKEWDRYLPYLLSLCFVSLLFFEFAVSIRRWLTLALVVPLAFVHIVFLEVGGYFSYAIRAAAEFGGGIFDGPFELYLLSGSGWLDIAVWVSYSILIAFVVWALLNWCGRAHSGRTLAEWGDTLASLPGRLIRGQLGLARSFWYFGVLGGTPIRIAVDAAVAASAMVTVVVAAVIGALYWSAVTLAVWRSGESYQGHRAWWRIAVALSVLSVVSLLAMVVMLGLDA